MHPTDLGKGIPLFKKFAKTAEHKAGKIHSVSKWINAVVLQARILNLEASYCVLSYVLRNYPSEYYIDEEIKVVKSGEDVPQIISQM